MSFFSSIIVLLTGIILPLAGSVVDQNVIKLQVDKAEAEYIYNLSTVDSLNQQLSPNPEMMRVVFELNPSDSLEKMLADGKEYIDKKDIDYSNYVGNVNAVKNNLKNLDEFLTAKSITNKYVIFNDVNPDDFNEMKKDGLSINRLKSISDKVVVKSSDTMLFTGDEIFIPLEIEASKTDLEEFDLLLNKIDKSIESIANLDDLNVEFADISVLSEEQLDSIKNSLPRDVYVFEKMKKITADMPSLAGYQNGKIGSEVLCELTFAPGYEVYCPMAKALDLLNEDYKRDLGTDLKITSAYRDYNLQSYLYANDGGTGFVAPPGRSLHGAGCAIDVAAANGGFIGWDEAGKVWLDENGYKYGLMQKQWQSRNSSTPEPWHYEFFTVVEDTGGLSLITREPTLKDVVVDLPQYR